MRKIYLQDSLGNRFPLNGERGIYFSELSGFGVMLSPSFGDLGNGFFATVNEEAEPQNAIAGTLNFRRGNPYPLYWELISWIMAADSLRIVYEPYDGAEVLRRVSINFIQKGELNEAGWLVCPASFLPLSPWTRPHPVEVTSDTTDEGTPLEYDYVYEPDLHYGSASSATITAEIAGDGHVPSSFLMRFFGAITDPVIRLVGNLTGKTYGVCSLAVTLGASDTLELSTLYTDSHIRRIAADGTVTDLIGAVDPSTEFYFHGPIHEPSTLSVESPAIFDGSVDLQVYYYYKTR